jgi:hypothetical protein
LSETALADAIRFRTQYGLQADEAWIRLVAADPAARPGLVKYGVPLTPLEVSDLNARAIHFREVSGVLRQYGANHDDEFAGVGRDVTAGDEVVIWFTSHLAEHDSAIRAQLSPAARFEVRPARWTLHQLDQFLSKIKAEEAWFSKVGVPLGGWGILIDQNAVEVKVSSKDPTAAARVVNHFGGQDWLIVKSDGIGIWTGPTGTLVVRAVTTDGRPVPELFCVPVPDDPAAFVGEDLWSTNADGTCRMTGLGATRFEVRLERPNPRTSEWEVVGRGSAVVPANGEGSIRIVVEE